jgi:hypothetical protein
VLYLLPRYTAAPIGKIVAAAALTSINNIETLKLIVSPYPLIECVNIYIFVYLYICL